MTVKRVGVVGSGLMGAGITECVAASGHEVVVRSRRPDAAPAMVAALGRSLTGRVEKGKLSEEDRSALLGRITTTSDLRGLAGCDLVIESIVEELAAKKHLFAHLDRVCRPDTILATNTSTLPVVELAMATGRPERVCGVHFFNPAPVTGVVELVRPLTASAQTMDECRSFVLSCGKQPVEVRDQAGFVVNALLFPYLNNAARLAESGVATNEDIDAAMKGACGHPMGPLALLDLVGLDISVAILDLLHQEFGDPNYTPVPLLRRMVSAGKLGRKSGVGFYRYDRPGPPGG